MKTQKLTYFISAAALLGLIGLAAAAIDPASPHFFRGALLEKVTGP
jgi:hypothetical protein